LRAQFIIDFNHKNTSTTNLVLPLKHLYFVATHLKLSSLFWAAQLIDICSYETPHFSIKSQLSIYHFHFLSTDHRCFLFLPTTSKQVSKTFSIAELFPNANWLERELTEMHNIFLLNKKDLRNLMLQYGDTSAPLLKSYPSVGTRELSYDSITDTISQTPVSLQF
jgi:NADH-quinone oxidoreductase subunit C